MIYFSSPYLGYDACTYSDQLKKGVPIMPRGDKSSYTDKQKRQAEHIEEGYKERDTPKKEGERREWATVNKQTGSDKKSSSGRGKAVSISSVRKGGKKGGATHRSSHVRSSSSKKAS